MNWSEEQQAIFNWFESGRGSLIVKARAGTGKTTTIKAAFEHAPEPRILYAVFNKKNQKEAESKIKDPRVQVKTLHSLGYSFIRKAWPGVKPDDEVEYDRIRAAGVSPDNKEMIGEIAKLVSFAKNMTTDVPGMGKLIQICDEYDVDFGDWQDYGCEKAKEVLEASKQKDKAGRISFNDMVWLPVACKMVRPIFNLVCIDEAQDMNLPQLIMAREACKKGGRIVVVGDDRQAIYGFRGAAQNGMGMMKMTLRAAELSLTTTYRCPRLVVELAKKTVPDYCAAEEAPEGLVAAVNEAKMHELIKPGDAILSRLNAPLMPAALSLLRRDIPARIEGRDIGRQLVGMVRLMKAKTIPQFVERVQAWAEKQRERLMGAKNAEKKIEQVGDIAETLVTLSDGLDKVSDIERRLISLFQDTDENSRPAVVLSTVHKAKGLEWGKVFMLSESFRRQGDEESNIYYVAVTRAMKELYLVGGISPKLPEKIEEPKSEKSSRHEKYEKKERPQDKPSDYYLPQGMRYRVPGDVIIYEGYEYGVEWVNECRAVARCLTREARTVTNQVTGEQTTFKMGAKVISISATCEPSTVVRRMDPDELKTFLERGTGSRHGQKQPGAKGNEEEMKGKVKITDLPTAGRAAFVHGLKAKGVDHDTAVKKTQAKFNCSLKAFDAIWEAKPKGKAKKAEKPAKVEKPAAPKKAKAKKEKVDKPAKPVKKAPKRKAQKPAPETQESKPSGPPPRPQVQDQPTAEA